MCSSARGPEKIPESGNQQLTPGFRSCLRSFRTKKAKGHPSDLFDLGKASGWDCLCVGVREVPKLYAKSAQFGQRSKTQRNIPVEANNGKAHYKGDDGVTIFHTALPHHQSFINSHARPLHPLPAPTSSTSFHPCLLARGKVPNASTKKGKRKQRLETFICYHT